MLANIKAEMSRHRESNASMAKLLGVSDTTFSFKLNERRDFTLNELIVMAERFGCSIDYLIALRRERQQPPDQAS